MKWLPLFVCLSAHAQGIWESRAPYPISATEVSSAALNGKVYSLCGLLPNGSRSTELFIYDPYRDEWTQGAPIPKPGGGDHCNVAAANGKLYVLGSIQVGTANVDGNTYEYDPQTDRWSTVGRMNEPRGASGVAVIGSRIYVAGGLAGGVVCQSLIESVRMLLYWWEGTMVIHVAEMSADQRVAIQALLGRQLGDDESVVIRPAHLKPGLRGAARLEAARRYFAHADMLAERVKNIPEEELDALVDEAIEHVRKSE